MYATEDEMSVGTSMPGPNTSATRVTDVRSVLFKPAKTPATAEVMITYWLIENPDATNISLSNLPSIIPMKIHALKNPPSPHL